ncbi:MAG: hypothetical protein MJ060_01660 [Clostridia bacterium]|nr:hypothetical protein [Clostridia bacterium]
MKMGMTTQLLAQQAYTGDQFMKDLGNIVVILVSIAGALMTLYAVYIAYLFWTATDANKRKAARERLIKTVASSLIVIGLAAVLTVINVRFNAAEGRISGPTVGQGGNYASDYTYAAEPVFMFTRVNGKAEGVLKLDSKYLQKNGAAIDPVGNKVKFEECQVVSPNWKEMGIVDTVDISNQVLGEMTYTIDLNGVTIPAGESESGSYYVTVAIKFTVSGDETMKSFNIKVILEQRSSGIVFHL